MNPDEIGSIGLGEVLGVLAFFIEKLLVLTVPPDTIFPYYKGRKNTIRSRMLRRIQGKEASFLCFTPKKSFAQIVRTRISIYPESPWTEIPGYSGAKGYKRSFQLVK